MESFKKAVPQFVWDYGPYVAFTIGGAWTIYELNKLSSYLKTRRMLNRWKNSPKDIVVVHTIERGKLVPNASPFALKLETYLRMANIPYQIDNSYPYSVNKGKTPWITFNGENVADSQFCIEFLARKFDKRIGSYSAEQRALGRAIRIMVDEYLYWGMALWRYVYDDGKNLHKIFPWSSFALCMFRRTVKKRVTTNSWADGIGRHSQEEVIHEMTQNLKALSLILGNRKFILGDEPSEVDCSVFGMLAQLLWCSPDSPYEQLINDEFLNLKEYCIRMKETFWPDWEKCLAVHNCSAE